MGNVLPRHGSSNPTAQRLPVKAKRCGGLRCIALRCAPAWTWPPAWTVTGSLSRACLTSPIRWPGLSAHNRMLRVLEGQGKAVILTP